MKTLTRSILVLILVLSTGCSTISDFYTPPKPRNLGWVAAKGSTNEQAMQDKKDCQHRAQFIKEDRFGRGQMTFYIQCMEIQGHKLVEFQE